MANTPRYWLVKSEPGCFSIDDLAALPGQTSMWDGVRNYQARNYLRDSMKRGDRVFFYHSITGVGIAGLCEVASEPYPDPTQWNPEDRHFDPASPADAPRWYVVDIRLVKKFARTIPLNELRTLPELAEMELLKRGSRLSVQSVREGEFLAILAYAEEDCP